MNERGMRRLGAIVAVLAAIGILSYASMAEMGEDLVYYWSPSELQARGDSAVGATVRLGGLVEPGSMNWSPETQTLDFSVRDGESLVKVSGKGAPPQMFREGIGVIVEGKLSDDGIFYSDEVLVRHSNEYQPPEEGERPEDIYRTLMTGDES